MSWSAVTLALEHRYTARGAAMALWKCRDQEVLLSGPAGTGKSRACMEKLHAVALRNPGMRGLIVRKTAVSLTSTALVTWREHVAKESLEVGHVRWYGGSPAEAARYVYTNGSTIVVGGMDKSNKVMSSEYDMIYVQEAIELTEDDWDKLSTRLRNGKVSFQQLMADTNPDTATHWLKDRCDRGVTRMLESRHGDNPVLFDDDGTPTDAGRDYLGRLDNLSGVRRLRLRDGLWVAAEGIIWDTWNEAIHLVDRKPIPKDWPRFWSIDFGYTNPFVCQKWAQDPDGRLVLYSETYQTQTLVEDHAAALKDEILRGEPRPRWIVADHDAEGRATFEKHFGQRTTPARKNVTQGLQAVASRLKVAGDGKPRLTIQRDAVRKVDPELVQAKKPTCTAQEIPGYVWGNSKTKEEPHKEDDHGCDALRYLIAQVDLGTRPGMRILK